MNVPVRTLKGGRDGARWCGVGLVGRMVPVSWRWAVHRRSGTFTVFSLPDDAGDVFYVGGWMLVEPIIIFLVIVISRLRSA